MHGGAVTCGGTVTCGAGGVVQAARKASSDSGKLSRMLAEE